MAEIEVPIEHLHEHIHEAAAHAHESWIGRVALYSAILAVVAAISALMAGHHANEAMIAQIRSSNAWSYFQAKSIKSSVLQSKTQLLAEMGRPVKPEDSEKLESYKKEQADISEEAKVHEGASVHHLHTHEIMARAVTLFQVAIAVSAVSVLTRKRPFWYVSLGFGVIGVGFFIQGLLSL